MKYISILIFALVTLHSTINAQTKGWSVKPFERKAFIENKGQFNEVLPEQYKNFNYCIDNGARVLFTPKGLTYVIKKINHKKLGALVFFMSEEKRERLEHEINVEYEYITMEWLNFNPNVSIETIGLQTTSYNYVMRNKGMNDYTEFCKGYSKIIYKNLYNGIDVEYFFTEKEGFKYNLIVSAGADINQVRMRYNASTKLLLDKGNLIIKNLKDNIIDHAPITYVTNDMKDKIESSFALKENVISFNVNNPNKQAITIDPWTVVPVAASPAFDNGTDNLGNIYLCGQGYVVEKYTATGTAPTWSLNFPTAYYGDMLVEGSGNFYLSEGFNTGGAHSYKFSPTSALIWTSTTPGADFREHWRLALNCVTNKIIVLGGGTTYTMSIAEIDVPTGTLTNIKGINGADMLGLAIDELGKGYELSVNDQLVFTDNANNVITSVNSGHGFSYTFTGYASGGIGYNAIALGGSNFLFTSNGGEIKKWDITTHALLASVAIPGGMSMSSSGILADKCNNLFVGSNSGVYRFDFNLVQKEFHATSSPVFDIAYASNGEIIACGSGFATSLDFGRESCGSIKTFVTSNPCDATINTVKVRPLLGIPPFTFLWDDGNTDSIRINLSAGIHIVTIKDASCIPQFIKDTVKFKATKAISVIKHQPCFGSSNGTLTVGLTQGQTITSYTITPSSTSSLLNDSTILATGLTQGAYTFHMVSNIGCSFDTTVQLTQLSAIITSIKVKAIAHCPGQATGAANVSASGSAPYTSPTAPYGYSWNTTPIQTDSLLIGVIEGKYIVTITDSMNCTKLDSVIIVANPTPVVDFTSDSACFKGTTTFTDNSTVTNGSLKSWAWVFGGTGITPVPTANIQNPTYTYNKCNNATNNATLVVTSDSGCVGVATNPVIVHCLPVPNFTFNNGCEYDDLIQFTNTSTNGAGTTSALISKWRLGLSPVPVISTNASYTYTAAGNYSINLNVIDGFGCSKDTTKPLIIYPKPVANFMVDSVCLNLANAFTNTSTLSVPAGFTDAVQSQVWNYNFDGTNYTTNATTPNTSHIYTLPATQTKPVAMLIVTTNHNCADTVSKPVIVWPLPKANYSMTAPCYPTAITFSNASTIATGTDNSAMASMVINWGNGQTQTVTGLNQTINYNHATSGNYISKLVVTSNHGCADSLNVPITVHAKPVANYTALPAKGCEPLCVNFVNISTQNAAPVTETIATYNWNFGDYNVSRSSDNKATTTNAKHCYTNPTDTTQLHTSQLIITTTTGCKDTLIMRDSIAVYPLPVADFKVSPSTVDMLNPELKIKDESHLAYTITWNYNNGDVKQDINPTPLQPIAEYVYQYKDSGTYIIKQLVQTNKGCADSISKPVRVNPIYSIYIPNAFTPNGDNINDYFMVKGINIKELDLIIFDRWGEVIARITSPTSKGWDGTDIRQGIMSQQEVYNWKLSYTDVFNTKHKGLVGTVIMLK